MIPYKEAGDTIKRQGEAPIRALGSAASVGAGALGLSGATASGMALMKRALPFLSKYIPEDLAIKGLSKLDPRFGKFIKGAMEDGHEFQEVKDFIEKKGTEEQEKPKIDRNIIEQYDPELYTYLQQNIKKGLPVFEAGKQALTHSRFKNAVDKMTKDHKAPWSSILQTVFGEENQSPKKQSTQPEQTQTENSSQGPVSQSLMSKMQRANQLLGM